MKRHKLYFVLIIWFASVQFIWSQQKSISFYNDFEHALNLAKSQNKNLFVNVYTSWSVPQKQMDAQVYNDPEVIEFISKRFVAVKLDADKAGRRFIGVHDIYAFPTFLFFDHDGEEMHRIIGYADEKRLLRSADISFRNPKKQLDQFKSDYRKNKNDPIFLRDYVAFAEEIENFELADKISNQYAKNYRKVRKVDWMDFVMRYVYKEDSKLFDLLKGYKDDFNMLYGEEEVNRVFLEIIVNSELDKMNNPETEKLIKNTKKRLNKYKVKVSDDELIPSLAVRVFNIEIPFENNDARTDLAALVLKKYIDEVEENHIRSMLATVAINNNNKDVMEIGKKEIDKLIAKAPSTSFYDLKSIFLYKLGEKEESYKQVALANEMANKTGQDYKSSLAVMKKAGLIK